jgi:ATP-binding protein involved in chromosome partitioning
MTTNADAHTPAQIGQRDAQTLAIEWADGETSLIDVRALRLACGCARCIDEWSGQPLLAPDSVPEDVAPQAIQSVGRYAIQIQWSDGHDTGIYPFERLRALSDRGLLSSFPESAPTDD